MKNRKISILVIMLLIATAVLPVVGTINKMNKNLEQTDNQECLSKTADQSSTPLLPSFLLKLFNGDWNYWSNTPHQYTIPEGHVGIGTDTPTEDLHIKGDLNYQVIVESTDAAAGIGLLADTGQAYGILAVPSDHSNLENHFVIQDVLADQPRLSIDKDGNVIINTLGAGIIFPDGTTQTTAGGGGGGTDRDWDWATGSGINGNIYHCGSVAIGTFHNPESKLEVHGTIHSTTGGIKFPDGSIQTTAAGSGGGGFPRPDYDSGWHTLNPGDEKLLTHNLGGSVDNYVIDYQVKDDDNGISNADAGIDIDSNGGFKTYGSCYHHLTSTSITLYVAGFESDSMDLRVRIWVYE